MEEIAKCNFNLPVRSNTSLTTIFRGGVGFEPTN